MDDFKIDHEQMQVITSLADPGVKVMLISEGSAKVFQMAEYGQFVVKTQAGKVTVWENTEKGKFV